jgi:hypothetical protein
MQVRQRLQLTRILLLYTAPLHRSAMHVITALHAALEVALAMRAIQARLCSK